MSVPADRINRRTGSKAAIKRASAHARGAANKLDRQALDDLTGIYRRAVAGLQADIRGFAGSDGSLRLDVLQTLLRQANQRLADLSRARDQLLDSNLVQGAQLGVAPFATDAAILTGSLTQIADEAVQFVRNFVQADGLQLSDRLWRIDRHARDVVGQAIESAVIQGQSASRAAQDFLARGAPVPRDLIDKIGLANAERVARQVGRDLMTGRGSPHDNALRLFRTEINRAHGEAYQAGAFAHPDTIGTKFLLSPRHPEPDICDMHARVNRWGLGPGVYPKGKNPWPAHPNTLSYVEVVFADEVASADRNGKETRIEWLGKQHPGLQQAVLNSRKKKAALDRGILHENEIATPWQVLKKRYERRGIDTDKLKTIEAEPLSIVPGGGVKPATTQPGSPVSQALVIGAQKKVSKHVLEIIDSVHSDGKLPHIPIRNAPSRATYYGAYRSTVNGAAVDIQIKAGSDHRELTMAHEIGHFIDHQGAPGKGFSSVGSAQFDAWREAVGSTQAVKSLRTLRDGPKKLTLQNGEQVPVRLGYIDYLLEYEELWARSYAQWITKKSADAVLTEQLSTIIQSDRSAAIRYIRQWDDADFRPVAAEIDKLMEALGWTR